MKVLDVFRIGDKLSVTLEGTYEEIKNGSKLIGSDDTEYEVISVAMTNNDNPSDFPKVTTVLMPDCGIERGFDLHIA